MVRGTSSSSYVVLRPVLVSVTIGVCHSQARPERREVFVSRKSSAGQSVEQRADWSLGNNTWAEVGKEGALFELRAVLGVPAPIATCHHSCPASDSPAPAQLRPPGPRLVCTPNGLQCSLRRTSTTYHGFYSSGLHMSLVAADYKYTDERPS